MRPRLHPALSRIWRDSTTLQVGLTPGWATLLSNLHEADKAVLTAMDGHADLLTLHQVAKAHGGTTKAVDTLVSRLLSVGAAVDQDRAWAETGDDPRGPDRLSAGLVERSTDGGAEALAHRAALHVAVTRADRIGAAVIRLLAASGIGHLTIHDDGLVTGTDVAPASHSAGDVGLSRRRALASRTGEVEPADYTSGPDFIVLTDAGLAEHSGLLAEAMRSGIPHLRVYVTEITGIVGPLVVPGVTACLRCIELHRSDRDPQWASVLDQAARHPPEAPACDSALATAVASLTTTHVIGHLSGHTVATLGGTLEVTLPSGLPRRRSWPPHPDCGCTWAADEAHESPSPASPSNGNTDMEAHNG